MNGQRVGSREVKTICLTPAQGGLFARWQMGGLVEATPLIWTSSVSPTNVNYGGIGEGWRGANMLLAVGVSLNPRIPPRGGPEVMSRRGSYHSPIHLDDGVIRFEISNH